MRKWQILGFLLFAVVGFSAITAASAIAITPEWLVEGAALAMTLNAETEGLLNLIALEGGNILNEIDCEGILDGTIGITEVGKGIDTVTSVLSLNQETISGTPLTGLALGCLVTASAAGLGDCELNALASVWPENLPWESELELMTAPEPEWLDHLFGGINKMPAWESECNTNIGVQSLLCEGLTSAAVTNAATVPPSVLGEFSAAAKSESSSCNVSGITGDLEGTGNTWAIGNELVRLETSIS